MLIVSANETKSTHVNFTNKKIKHLPILLDHQMILHENLAKYLGITLGCKLMWKEPVKKSVTLTRHVLKPVWVYGVQRWGCSKKYNI